MINEDRNPLLIGRNVRLTVIHPHCIRIEEAADGRFVDAPSLFAIERDARCAGFSVKRRGGAVVVDTGAIRLTCRTDGRPLGPRNLSARIRCGKEWTSWKPGQTNRGNLGGTAETLDNWTVARELPPGLISRDGWFLLDDSGTPLLADGWVKARPGTGRDWYLFGYGRDYRAAFQALAAIAGRVPLPRRYTLGAWYSRYWPYTSDDFLKIVREYKTKDFPLDMVVMDMDWHVTDMGPGSPPGSAHWTGYTWNRKLLPDAERLIAELRRQGLRVTLNDHPADGVQPHESMYRAFMKDMGANPRSGRTLPFDAGSRRYLETFYKHTHTPREREGVDFWWLDWQQFAATRSIPSLRNLPWLNLYYFRRSQEGGRRGQSLSRWGGWGDHRHPIHFSGDANTGWRMLAAEVPFTSTAGNAGCFFWSHDIGGHMGGRNEESYTRWCQFGALSASMRSHSSKDARMDRRPWAYPSWAESSMQRSFHLRSELFPTLYAEAARSCRDTFPLIRPLYLEWPGREDAYRNPQEYLFGDNLLVAPVTEPGIGPRRLARQAVWFPPGTWYNVFTGERFEGPAERLVAADIDEFPLYVRAGAPLLMQPYTPRMGTDPFRRVIVRCWPGASGVSLATELYEDDGQTDGYERGECARTPVRAVWRDGEVCVTFGATAGEFAGQLDRRVWSLELPVTRQATAAFIDGQPVRVQYDAASRTNCIELPARAIRRGGEVVVRVAAADPELVAAAALARRAGLGRVTAGTPCPKLLRRALAKGTTMQKRLALRAAGVGLFGKVESVYGYPDDPNIFFYAPAEFGVKARMRLGTGRTACDVRLTGLRTPIDMPRLLSRLPGPADELYFPQAGIELAVQYSILGRAVSGTETYFAHQPYWPFRRNLAPRAKVTASSAMDDQPASGAIDGIVDGLPGDRTHEWASRGEKAGAWIQLDWAKPVAVSRVLLFDRPNYADHILAGKVELSDGTVLPVGELPADGRTPFELHFRGRKIRWVRFTVTEVSELTGWVGLSEIAVFRD